MNFQVGILGNAADFSEDQSVGTVDGMDRRQMMIAFDMRYKGVPDFLFSYSGKSHYVDSIAANYTDAWDS